MKWIEGASKNDVHGWFCRASILSVVMGLLKEIQRGFVANIVGFSPADQSSEYDARTKFLEREWPVALEIQRACGGCST